MAEHLQDRNGYKDVWSAVVLSHAGSFHLYGAYYYYVCIIHCYF